MKKLLMIGFAALVGLSSCASAYQCPTYSQHNKVTKHGMKAQAKYHKHGARRPSAF